MDSTETPAKDIIRRSRGFWQFSTTRLNFELVAKQQHTISETAQRTWSYSLITIMSHAPNSEPLGAAWRWTEEAF